MVTKTMMKKNHCPTVPAPIMLRQEDEDFDFSKIEGVTQKIVHWKGFGGGIDGLDDPKSPNYAKLMSAVDFIMSIGNDGTIVWDGDDYDPMSFTNIIPTLMDGCPQMKFVAFKNVKDIDKFMSRWERKDRLLAVVSVEVGTVTKSDGRTGTDYPQLGEKALIATGSKIVVCLGGGDVVGSEYERNMARPDPATWHVFDAVRTVKGVLKHGAIYEMLERKHKIVTHA